MSDDYSVWDAINPPPTTKAKGPQMSDVRAALQAAGVRVKPLEWTPRPDGRQWYATSARGLYVHFTAVMGAETGVWSCYLDDFWRPFASLEAAKAAAQADYEARIFAALKAGHD